VLAQQAASDSRLPSAEPKRLTSVPRALATASGPVSAALIVVIVWLGLNAVQPEYIFPSIGSVLQDILAYAGDGQLWQATLITARSVVLGSLAALLMGVLYGFAMHRFPRTCGPLLNFLQTVPPIVYALMAIVWFGINFGSVVFVIFIVGFPIVALNTAEGLGSVDRLLLEMADACRASRGLVVREIVLPSLTPYLLSATRIMVSFSWRFAILGEIFAGGSGVGYKLNFAYQQSQMSHLFAWTLWLVALMWASEYGLILPLERWLTRWRA
jgi:NitT/TauT family transport system permease protein/phthalate transport system permease protein